MRVIQILPELNEGGVERGTLDLNREFVKRGIQSFVISNGGKLAPQITKDGGIHIQVDVCSKNPLTAPWRIWQLYKQIKKISPDILHVRSRVPAWMVYFANKALKLPVVSTVHGLNSVNRYSAIMTNAAHVICVGNVVKDHIIKNYNTPNEKITIIQRGVDLNRFSTENIDNDFIAELKDKYNLHDKYLITSVGRITWLKDYETFISGIKLAKEKVPNIVGLIIGGTNTNKEQYFQTLVSLAKKEGVFQDIIFLGNQQKMAEIYHMSDILVNASLKMGNIARTITESLAMNTPVIATTFEGLDNIINESNGVIIPTKNPQKLSDAICHLHNKNLTNPRETLNKEYTLDYMANSTITIYEKVLRKNS